MADMHTPLLPCPFCGGEAGRLKSWNGNLSSMVCCVDPNCLGYHHEQDEQGGWNHEVPMSDAIAAWNRRAPSQDAETIKALREALEDALDIIRTPVAKTPKNLLKRVAAIDAALAGSAS